MLVVDHPADNLICSSLNPAALAYDVDADRVLWLVNCSVLIPDCFSVYLTHLAIVTLITALCGLLLFFSETLSALNILSQIGNDT